MTVVRLSHRREIGVMTDHEQAVYDLGREPTRDEIEAHEGYSP